MLEFLRLFAVILFFPILPIVVCGLIAGLSEKLFLNMTRRCGQGLVMATSIIGTPIHELGHAIMCFPFGHKIKKVCLWNPKAKNGVLGYVNHTYNKKNIWHRLGCLFISMGPIILGLLVVLIIVAICFPEICGEYFSSVFSVDTSLGGFVELISTSIGVLFSSISDSSSPIWVKILGGVLIICVCMHINMSPADIKNSLGALPIYSLICLVLSAIMFFVGGNMAVGFTSALAYWCFMGFALYTVVFAGMLAVLLIGLLCYIIGRIFSR